MISTNTNSHSISALFSSLLRSFEVWEILYSSFIAHNYYKGIIIFSLCLGQSETEGHFPALFAEIKTRPLLCRSITAA